MAVFFRMRFGRFGGMVRGMFMMPTGGMRMMRRFLVIPGFMMFGGFFVMPRGVLMMFRRVLVMLGCFGGHGHLPGKGVATNNRCFPSLLKCSGTTMRLS